MGELKVRGCHWAGGERTCAGPGFSLHSAQDK